MALYVVSDDGGFGSISGTAFGAVTAGDLIRPYGTAELAVTSDFATAKFKVKDTSGDELLVVGVALTSATSGSLFAIATRGFFMMKAGAAITTGTRVKGEDSTDTDQIVDLADATINNAHIGKAFTGCSAAGEYALVKLNIA